MHQYPEICYYNRLVQWYFSQNSGKECQSLVSIFNLTLCLHWFPFFFSRRKSNWRTLRPNQISKTKYHDDCTYHVSFRLVFHFGRRLQWSHRLCHCQTHHWFAYEVRFWWYILDWILREINILFTFPGPKNPLKELTNPQILPDIFHSPDCLSQKWLRRVWNIWLTSINIYVKETPVVDSNLVGESLFVSWNPWFDCPKLWQGWHVMIK